MPTVLEGASELFRQRSFAQVVSTCKAELAAHPEEVDVRILLARALMALRRDGEAQAEVSQCLRQRPRCPEAYQLLEAEIRAVIKQSAIYCGVPAANSATHWAEEVFAQMEKDGLKTP